MSADVNAVIESGTSLAKKIVVQKARALLGLFFMFLLRPWPPFHSSTDELFQALGGFPEIQSNNQE
jgi:hypothetical protein